MAVTINSNVTRTPAELIESRTRTVYAASHTSVLHIAGKIFKTEKVILDLSQKVGPHNLGEKSFLTIIEARVRAGTV